MTFCFIWLFSNNFGCKFTHYHIFNNFQIFSGVCKHLGSPDICDIIIGLDTWQGTSLLSLHEKPCFLFPDVLKRWYFQKNCTGIWSFLYYQERWYFFFPKIWSYSLDTKWKMIFLKKIFRNMIFSSNVLKRWSFQKIRTWTCSFL